MNLILILLSFLYFTFHALSIDRPSLPDEHLEYFFKSNPHQYDLFCSNQQVNTSISSFNCSRSIDDLKCWGYEDLNCKKWKNGYIIKPYCTEKFPNYENLDKNKQIFYDEADFGYLKKRREELKTYCQSNASHSISSSLECTDHLRFCKGENIYIDFRRLNSIKQPMRYRTDVIEDGDIGGFNCNLNRKLLASQNQHKSPLQSWFEELEHFTISNDSFDHKKYDLVINRTLYVMKLDATVNFYHHFCDFFNLYMSLHLANDFSLDKQILIWDTYPYRSNFAFTWNAFTNHKLLNLDQFKGKKVFFKKIVFPFLPRMIFGLYYNTPLIKGCHRSGLFHAFNRHLLNNLGILKNYDQLFNKSKLVNLDVKSIDKLQESIEINITFLSRSTAYRKVLNENELIDSIRDHGYKVIKVDFNHQFPFEKQLEIISKTDILIGMHGAGLTHCLFLPDWAVLFELFDCDDQCYKDLARLRGIKHITWKHKSKLKYIRNEDQNKPAHLKFTDYQFDKDEFLKRLNKGIKYVKKRKVKYYKNLIRKDKKDDKSFKLRKIEL